ncbi:MAG: hypothetical protein JO212_09150 [Acetobacteraceae bacterium]|nr:hypothetical protein [Acetobacteraceae bacterium]
MERKRVGLRLVASNDDRALVIRDHLLRLIRARGTLEDLHGPVRAVVLKMGPWGFVHWTPFNELLPGEALSPGYRHALERQRVVPTLPYGLQVIWHGTKVLNLLWGDNEHFAVATFIRGYWEEEALKL